MSLLLTLLTTNTVVHGIVVARFGVRNNNQPFLLFAIVYAALAIAVYLSVPYALWMVLLLAVIGILVSLVVLVGLQVRSIMRSPYPALRALESLALTVPLFLLAFAVFLAWTGWRAALSVFA